MNPRAYAEQLSTDPAAQALAVRFIRAIAEERGFEEGGEEVIVDMRQAIDGLLFAVAMIIEYDPAMRNPADFRRAGDEAGALLRELAKRCREITDASGTHMLETVGARGGAHQAH